MSLQLFISTTYIKAKILMHRLSTPSDPTAHNYHYVRVRSLLLPSRGQHFSHLPVDRSSHTVANFRVHRISQQCDTLKLNKKK